MSRVARVVTPGGAPDPYCMEPNRFPHPTSSKKSHHPSPLRQPYSLCMHFPTTHMKSPCLAPTWEVTIVGEPRTESHNSPPDHLFPSSPLSLPDKQTASCLCSWAPFFYAAHLPLLPSPFFFCIPLSSFPSVSSDLPVLTPSPPSFCDGELTPTGHRAPVDPSL
jgi:hypothetical protein